MSLGPKLGAVVARFAETLREATDPDAPLSPGLDPSRRSGPSHLYERNNPLPGECPACGAPDPRYALRWEPEARCKACVARLADA